MRVLYELGTELNGGFTLFFLQKALLIADCLLR